MFTTVVLVSTIALALSCSSYQPDSRALCLTQSLALPGGALRAQRLAGPTLVPRPGPYGRVRTARSPPGRPGAHKKPAAQPPHRQCGGAAAPLAPTHAALHAARALAPEPWGGTRRPRSGDQMKIQSLQIAIWRSDEDGDCDLAIR